MFFRRDDPATRLRTLMAERDINTQELADLAGVSRTTVSSLRSGTVQRPTSYTMYAIAEALETKPNKIWPWA